MRAMVMTAYGAPEVLQFREMPEPVLRDDDVLIEVHATAMNPIDYKVRAKPYGGPRDLPCILGFDVSGVIRALGRNARHLKVGDSVFASPSLARNGADAELVAVDWRTVAHTPRTLDHVNAAALPLAVLTAWESLHKRAGIHPGQTVLIHAGAGGVGHLAVQLAKLHGCRVITTAGMPETIDLCRELGADVVINHTKEDFVKRVSEETATAGCPVVFDTVGGEVFDRSLECVGLNGRIVTIVYNESAKIVPLLFRKNATLHCEFMGVPTVYGVNPESQGEILRTVAELVDAGRLAPHVGKVMELKDLPQAHREQETGRTIGKTVVRVKG
ncbi:MAG: zinc-binding dehydrogenase [Planctomycetes bacterium]|nr:zinc-binding dehydrogenase [Planctomycetota bacterium]